MKNGFFILFLLLAIQLNAQVFPFDNPGFEDYDFSCGDPCTAPNLNCLNNWWSIPGDNAGIQCEEVCEGDLALSLKDNSGTSSIAMTNNPVFMEDLNTDVLTIDLDVFIINSSDIADIIVYGTNDIGGNALNLLGATSIDFDDFGRCISTSIAIQPDARNFEFLAFSISKKEGGHIFAEGFIDNLLLRVCDELFNVSVLTSDCEEACLRITNQCGIVDPFNDNPQNGLTNGLSGFLEIVTTDGQIVQQVPFIPIINGELVYCFELPPGDYIIQGNYGFFNIITNNAQFENFAVSYSVPEIKCCLGSDASFSEITSAGSFVVFYSYASPSEDCEIVSTSWDFGDGSAVCNALNGCESPLVGHDFEYCGTYEVCHTVIDDCNCETTNCQIVTIDRNCEEDPCRLLEASFVYAPQGDQFVFFHNSSIDHANCQIDEIRWSFGDGSPVLTLGRNDINFIPHTYEDCGTYEVCLTILDACGCTSTQCQMITNIPEIEITSCTPEEQECDFCWQVNSAGQDPGSFNWSVLIAPPSGPATTQNFPGQSQVVLNNVTPCSNLQVCVEVPGCDGLQECIFLNNVCASSCSGEERASPLQQSSETSAAVSEIRIFPNPAQSEINIQSTHSSIRQISIIDASGKRLETLRSQSTEVDRIDVSDWPRGIYLIECEMMDGEKIVEKFVKM